MNKRYGTALLVGALIVLGAFSCTRRPVTPVGNGGQTSTTTPTSIYHQATTTYETIRLPQSYDDSLFRNPQVYRDPKGRYELRYPEVLVLPEPYGIWEYGPKENTEYNTDGILLDSLPLSIRLRVFDVDEIKKNNPDYKPYPFVPDESGVKVFKNGDLYGILWYSNETSYQSRVPFVRVAKLQHDGYLYSFVAEGSAMGHDLFDNLPPDYQNRLFLTILSGFKPLK